MATKEAIDIPCPSEQLERHIANQTAIWIDGRNSESYDKQKQAELARRAIDCLLDHYPHGIHRDIGNIAISTNIMVKKD